MKRILQKMLLASLGLGVGVALTMGPSEAFCYEIKIHKNKQGCEKCCAKDPKDPSKPREAKAKAKCEQTECTKMR